MESRDTGVVILAAGRSERMKEMKAFLMYNDCCRFIDKITSTYSSWGCNEIVVVTNREAFEVISQLEEESPVVRVVCNEHPEFERFYSVKLGLELLKSSFCFIQNVDNPFIDGHILDMIYHRRNEEKYVSPVFGGRGGHPVLLNRINIRRISGWSIDSDSFKTVLRSMECLEVDMPDDRVLININTPEEYTRFIKAKQNGVNL